MSKCPICHKELTDTKYRPFCSKRCADIDLGHWFSEDYTVPAVDLDEQEILQIQSLEDIDEVTIDLYVEYLDGWDVVKSFSESVTFEPAAIQ